MPNDEIVESSAATLPVLPGESEWTPGEAAEVVAELRRELERLRRELTTADTDLFAVMRDSDDGAGDDQIDNGATAVERSHALSVRNSIGQVLTQTEHALERMREGTFGVCEICGGPIGKARLQAFARATACVACGSVLARRH